MPRHASRRAILGGALTVSIAAALAGSALAQGAGDPIRKIVIITDTQGAMPQAYQAGQLIAQEWRKLGLDVEARPMARQAQTDLVWFNRDKWDTTMWRMVGRPERSDPDEMTFNLFHSSTAPRGFNFVGYNSPDYDKVAEQQRQTLDPTARQALIKQAQEIVNRDAPYAFLLHPNTLQAFNQNVFDPASIVVQKGVGIRNFWTFIGAAPKGAQKAMIINSGTALQAIHPLYIAGAPDSWMNELIWDRLVRIGPDGLPRPWAAESFKFVDDKTVDIVIRGDMKFHDGKPVTIDDVIFSYEAPLKTDKSPMFKPFVTDIDRIEKTGDRSLRMHLKRANAAFATTALGRVFIVPRHVWEPHLKSLEGKPDTLEAIRDPANVGSGPFKQVRARLNEEIVIERHAEHWAAPKVDRVVLRVIPNAEAVVGMLRSGEINLLSEYGGDPDVLDKLAKDNAAIKLTQVTDVGIEFLAFNNRRPPFDDVAFRNALSAAIDRNVIVQAAWNGYAVRSVSHVSPAIEFWHARDVKAPPTGLDVAKSILDKAGYKVEGGKLRYPAGKKEALQPPG
ncbi:MAG: twin-arginine translocation pathway signal protein [Methylobacteriaceae bacterium]|nr:twin-arginine translocation pathway signal protein [Methylobacteriaceae bacterium]